MSNTECYYIEEIPISNRCGSDPRCSPESRRLDVEQQQRTAENRCTNLKDQLASIKIKCENSDEKGMVSATASRIKSCKMEKVLKEEEMVKPKKKTTKVTVLDTYVQSAATIYAGTRKIPATSNLQRKSFRSKSVRMTDDRLKKRIDLKSSLSKLTSDDFRKTRKMKCFSSKTTLGGRTTQSVDAYRPYRNPFQHWNSDIVELYHNNAIKTLTESASDNSLTNRDKKRKSRGVSIPTRRLFQKHTLPPTYSKGCNAVHQVDLQKKPSFQQAKSILGSQIETVPVRDQPTLSQQFIQRSQYRFPNQSVDVPIVDQMQFQAPYVPQNFLAPIDEKTATSFHQSNYFPYSRPSTRSRQDRHYELPTISSKLKQVTRNYFHQLNIKTIPFVTARSTTPSHNLGLNIQQVLNIMKTHQPISGISPTLAHNMGIVAGGSFAKGTDETINGILSRMSSKQSCCYNRRPMCPLLRQVESELADVPEHPCEDDTADPPNDNFDFKQRVATEWDQASPRACKQTKCTCQLKKGVNYNKVFNQYLEYPVQSTQSTNSQFHPVKQPRNLKSAFSMQTSLNPSQYNIPPVENQPINFHYQLAGKVRGLRDVLTHLHDDFQKMNERYDALSEKLKTVQDPKTIQQLEEMEKDLNAKEEEISVVISLYKEVLALKEQVRTLKVQTSVLSMTGSHKNRTFEPTVSLRLTKVLRQIQHFQGVLKQRE